MGTALAASVPMPTASLSTKHWWTIVPSKLSTSLATSAPALSEPAEPAPHPTPGRGCRKRLQYFREDHRDVVEAAVIFRGLYEVVRCERQISAEFPDDERDVVIIHQIIET